MAEPGIELGSVTANSILYITSINCLSSNAIRRLLFSGTEDTLSISGGEDEDKVQRQER